MDHDSFNMRDMEHSLPPDRPVLPHPAPGSNEPDLVDSEEEAKNTFFSEELTNLFAQLRQEEIDRQEVEKARLRGERGTGD